MSLRNPVKYPVKYYSWQDDQAPKLENVDGAIKTILKACLVTGYGSKQGAGWTSLFEDAYRIVLRRPLRTGNPPDIKIENGTITGTTKRHRIVAQDNPSSLDDTVELSAVNLLARDNQRGNDWYCAVTDFAFILCYQMADNDYTGNKNHLCFIGSCKKLLDSDADYFFASSGNNINNNGTGTAYIFNFLNGSQYLYDMRRKSVYSTKNFINIAAPEKYFNNDYLAQKIIIDKVAELPFFCAISSQFDNLITSQIDINGRTMLRYVNSTLGQDGARAFYIPIDYWEL